MKLPLITKKDWEEGAIFHVLAFEDGLAYGVNEVSRTLECLPLSRLTALSEEEYQAFQAPREKVLTDEELYLEMTQCLNMLSDENLERLGRALEMVGNHDFNQNTVADGDAGGGARERERGMKYLAVVRRKEYREHTFEVEAGSKREAHDRALEMACDHDFNQNTVAHADEQVILLHESPGRESMQ